MEIDLTLGGILLLGMIIGLQHALEPDHLAAVSSLVAGDKSWKSIVRHGAVWGLGHTIALSAVAGSVVILGGVIEDGMARSLEGIVGLMLVVLGGHVIFRLVRDKVHFHVHRHGDGTVHFHAHTHKDEMAPQGRAHKSHPHEHEHTKAWPVRSLMVGLMHGLAGSAALVVLTAAEIADPVFGLIYVAIFGFGSILGMVALSGAIAMPIGWTAERLTWANTVIRCGIGFLTAGLGMTVAIASFSPVPLG